MSAAQSFPFPGRRSGPDLKLVTIMTSARGEDDLFRKFLSRGSAFTSNPNIRNTIRQLGYYSVFHANWTGLEKSFIFISTSYQMRLQPTDPSTPPENSGPSPMFKVHIVGNLVLVPNEFWGDERDWLHENKQPVGIADMMTRWIKDWGLKSQIESSIPVKNHVEIDQIARKLRLPMLAKFPGQKSEDRGKQREKYSLELESWYKLIQDSINDLSCLATPPK